MKLCKKQKILASRLQRPVATRNDVIAKKLLAVCFKTVADGPKTGLLAARAISSTESEIFLYNMSSLLQRCTESEKRGYPI